MLGSEDLLLVILGSHACMVLQVHPFFFPTPSTIKSAPPNVGVILIKRINR